MSLLSSIAGSLDNALCGFRKTTRSGAPERRIETPQGIRFSLVDVFLEVEKQRFFLQPAGSIRAVDVTDLLSVQDKTSFACYNRQAANDQASDQARADRGEPPVVVGPTTTTGALAKQVSGNDTSKLIKAGLFISGAILAVNLLKR